MQAVPEEEFRVPTYLTMMHAGTGKRYGVEQKRGEIEAWGGIVSARLSNYAVAFGVEPQAILDAVEAEGITPTVDTAEPKGRGSDTERPTSPELRCLAFTREGFARLVEAIGDSPKEAAVSEAIGGAGKEPAEGETVGTP